MARLLVPIFLFLCVAALGGPARAADFLSGTEDVPLMAGLTELDDGAMVFDTPQGRIVEVTAKGRSADAVRAFYAESLPQLGWAPAGEDAYRREGEMLRLEFIAPDSVRFVLAPDGR